MMEMPVDVNVQVVFEQYEAKFQQPLAVPLDYGFVNLPDNLIAAAGVKAIEEGKPVDWSRYLQALPEGAQS